MKFLTELVHQPRRFEPITVEELAKGRKGRRRILRRVLIRKTTGTPASATDAKGETWFLEFDPSYFHEGAPALSKWLTKISGAWGKSKWKLHHVRLEDVDRSGGDAAAIGQRTPFTLDDVNTILERVHQHGWHRSRDCRPSDQWQ